MLFCRVISLPLTIFMLNQITPVKIKEFFVFVNIVKDSAVVKVNKDIFMRDFLSK